MANDMNTNEFNVETVFPFCFPQGSSFRIIPKCAIQGAQRLGWIGREADRYQVPSFQDIKGLTTYGISITVTRQVQVTNIEKIQEHLRKYRLAKKYFLLWRKYRRTFGG